MKRLHLFELEDQTWFPQQLRSLITDLLQYEFKIFKIYTPIVPDLKNVLQQLDCHEIVDLCSGSSGQWLELQKIFNSQENYPIKITLTDKYPNIEAFQRVRQLSDNSIDFISQSIDVTNVPEHLTGFRTIFTAFHHFQPDMAKKILQDAVDKRAAIGIFEFTDRTSINIIISIILVPFIVIFLTPFVRPFKWSRLFWTYILPIAPFIVSWDAFVSYLRTYTSSELQELLKDIKSEDYTWKVGKIRSPRIPSHLIYLIGCPSSKTSTQPHERAIQP